CETGSPRFLVDGVIKTFEQWQAMGYDEHSVILNPEFIDLINFVPKVRLDKGKDLGTEWKTGLSRIAKWSNVDPATADQNGTWQVGAVIYESSGPTPPPLAVIPEYVSSVINSANPSVIVATYNSELATIVPPVSSFIVNVNSVPRPVNSLTVTGKNVNITLASPVVTGDAVSLAYNAPSTDGIMTPSGGKAASMTAKTVQNNVLIAAIPVYTGSVIENSTPSRLEIFFNLNLTNIVPAISAFTATVNGTSIKINSVSVSGNKVNLALSRPLLYGDEVFISYSKPDINPLQTPSGSTVESILSEFVANNILETDGFNEDGQNKIVVYPNPAIDYITVSNLQPSENLRIVKIFNYAGKVLLEHQLDTHASKRIPVNLESGMYFLQIFAGQIV
ncbi:T9SS type A sorting domain-containing protein, partial [bacterium]|nr:T9SS type A sorting domain-containing protein [bacterium]